MVRIEFETDNAAFEENPVEIERILRRIGEISHTWHRPGTYSEPIFDINGNRVGVYRAEFDT